MIYRATGVALGGRAVLIEGAPGSGKSSLALAWIDRGAALVGDDAVALAVSDGRLLASSPPNVTGLLEIRNVGLVRFPTQDDVPVALILRLDAGAPRFADSAENAQIAGLTVPRIALWPDSAALVLRAEAALEKFGLA